MNRALAVVVLLSACAQDTGPELLVTPPAPDVWADTVDATVALDAGADLASPIDVRDGGPPDVTPDAGVFADVVDTLDAAPDVAPLPPPPYALCDAGDEAWVKTTLQVLLGRRATGMREVHVLTELVQAVGREAVARGMMSTPEFETRWGLFFLDELRVNRSGDKMHAGCYGAPIRKNDAGDVAAWLRDHGPSEKPPGGAFNMADVLRSSLRLDDLSPLYLGHLFAMLAKPITGANVGLLEMDMTRRQDFGQVFQEVYLHRNIVCVGCHNSQFSTTDSPDPALDRSWPLPGLFEKALFGQSNGTKELTFFSVLRHLFVFSEEGTRPWGWSADCGRFLTAAQIPDDPAGIDAFFVGPIGTKSNIWWVEALFRTGLTAVRESGLTLDPATMAVDGPDAFAYLWATRIANQVWAEVLGYPLTLVHYLPRNRDQRDLLLELTTRFISSGFSPRSLLAHIVTHPLYNENAPQDGCGLGHPYLLPAILNPWSPADADPNAHGNGTGDGVHRWSTRVLLSTLSSALGWPAPLSFPTAEEEIFQKALGVFVKDGEPGFGGVDFQGLLAWENRYGACPSPYATTVVAEDSCVGRCGGAAPSQCQCNAECVLYKDCCDDYQKVCQDGAASGGDTIDALIQRAEQKLDAGEAITLGDVVAALKDRLLTAPDVTDPDEASAVAALFGAAALTAPLASVEGWRSRLRLYCGALTESPQFWLAGLPPEDQATEPLLTIDPLGSYTALCERWTTRVLDPAAWVANCGSRPLVVTKVQGAP